MKTLPAVASLAILVIVGGCQNQAASKLAGRWDLVPPGELDNTTGSTNDDSTKATVENTEDLFNSVAGGDSSGTMSLVFHSNGKLETFTDFPMASSGKPKTGTWKLISWDADEQVAMLQCDLFDALTETRVRFIDPDTIQLVPPNIAVLETEYRFRRTE